MSRSYTPFHGRSRKGGTAMIALIAATAVVVIGGVAAAVTLTGGGHQNASLTSSPSSQGATAPGMASGTSAPGAPSFTAVANVTPPVAATDCAAPSTFTYSGTLSAAAPGTVKYQWVYSSGQPGPVRTVNFTAAGQRLVTGGTVTAKTAGGGWGEIKVVSPAARTSDKAAYKLLCGGSSVGGVTVTAAITPAARTASCATAAPSFTATGSIEAFKAERVTYYWALSNGRDSTPATLAFAGPGTKSAAPLTITPSAASGAGEAVLVITSPVTTASAPAKYTLTCKALANQPTTSPTGPGNPTSNPTTPASNPTNPGNSPTSPAGSPSSPVSNPTTPGSSPTSPAGSQSSPSSPASNPTTAQSSPPGNSGGGSMYIPEIDTLSATLEVGYSVSFGTEVDGGVAPYTWSMTGLPPGVKQMPQATGSTAGSAIIGTVNVAGTYPFTVTVTDSEQPRQTLTEHFTIVVLQPNSEVWGVIGPPPLSGTVGVPFSTYFSATNGVTATFSVSTGELPPGISLNSTTGVLAGTPTERGIFNFAVVATNVATGGTKLVGTYNFSIDPAT